MATPLSPHKPEHLVGGVQTPLFSNELWSICFEQIGDDLHPSSLCIRQARIST